MRLDGAARLERLLANHPDAVVADDGAGRTALHRRDQVLVSSRHAGDVHDAASRWVERREDFTELGVVRLHLKAKAKVSVPELVTQLRSRGHSTGYRHYAVTPNHLLRGEPSYEGGPWDAPEPAKAFGLNEPGAPDRQVVVGILDTGVDEHPWFAECGWFADCGEHDREVLDGNHDHELDTEAGHGTFIAGVILQHAPDSWLRVDKVLSSDGVCDELRLLRGLSAIHRRGLDHNQHLEVLNLSLGGYTFDDRPSPLLADAIRRLGKHTVIVAAAGNHGSDRPFWPAALKEVIAVGALTADGSRRADFSNYGWWVDACAVGEDVRSSFVSFQDEDGPHFHGYATWSGTSFAAPQVAGTIAGLAAEKEISVRDAADLVLDGNTNLTMPDLGVVVDGIVR